MAQAILLVDRRESPEIIKLVTGLGRNRAFGLRKLYLKRGKAVLEVKIRGVKELLTPKQLQEIVTIVKFQTALKTIQHTRVIATSSNIELRRDINFYEAGIFEDLKEYQKLIELLEKFLKENDDLTEEKKAEVNARIGFCKVKLGDKEGESMIRDSIKILENPTIEFVHQNKDVVAIWETGAKLKLAQVLDNKGEARKIVEEVLVEAKEKGLGAREKEAEQLLANL